MTTARDRAGAMMGAIMIDRADTEATLYRVAVSAFTYYPRKETDEPGYRVDEDVDWCAAPLRSLPMDHLARLRDHIRVMITEPTADRRGFMRELDELIEQ